MAPQQSAVVARPAGPRRSPGQCAHRESAVETARLGLARQCQAERSRGAAPRARRTVSLY
jgi:hypothetical protein